jgi:hypothetical protein
MNGNDPGAIAANVPSEPPHGSDTGSPDLLRVASLIARGSKTRNRER